jgi:hypothetical protein
MVVDRPNVFELTQIGLETDKGTSVPATRQLASMSILPTIDANKQEFRPAGFLVPTITVMNTEHVTASLEGAATYNEIQYPLASVIKNVTPTQIMDDTTETGAYSWVFNPSVRSFDDAATFTVEYGNPDYSSRFSYGIVTEFNMNTNREGIELGGSMIGQALDFDNVELTENTDVMNLIPIQSNTILVYMADTHAGLDSAEPLQRVLSLDWSISDRWGPIYVLNAERSYAGHVALVPPIEVGLTMQADSEGMEMLGPLRNDTRKFVRMESYGPLIYSDEDELDPVEVYHKFRVDFALNVMDVGDFSESDGLTTLEWSMIGVYDGEWNEAMEVEVVNEIASL